MLTRHREVLKQKKIDATHSAHKLHPTRGLYPVYISFGFLIKNAKIFDLLKDIVCQQPTKPNKLYYKTEFFEFQRKYRGIIQILFRHFQFCKNPKEFNFTCPVECSDNFSSCGWHGKLVACPFDCLVEYLDYTLNDYTEENHVVLVSRCKIEKRLLFCYTHLLPHYWQRHERKTLPFDKMIRSRTHNIYHNFKDNANFYYYSYDLNGKFQDLCDKRTSCYIHGLTISDPNWQQYCEHFICFECDEYYVSRRALCFCSKFSITYDDESGRPLISSTKMCKKCGNCLYERIVYFREIQKNKKF